jgi:type I restriction enzyme S subunit
VTRPLWSVAQSADAFGRPDLPLLSMSAAFGLRQRPEEGGRAASEDLSGYRVVEPGWLVVNKLSARDGALAVSELHGIVSPAYWVLRLDEGLVWPRFLHYYLRSSPVLGEIWRRSKFMPPGQFDLPWDQFRSLRLDLPAMDEQRRIADFLNAQIARLDGALKQVQALARMAELQRASRLAEAYQDLPAPDLLEGRAANSVVSVRGLTLGMLSGGTPPTGDPSYWDDDGVPWIAIGDMVDGGTTQATRKALSPAGLAAARLRPAPAGTVLFAMYASVGKTTVTGMTAVWNQAILGLVPRPGVDPDFLLGWLELARPSLPAIARSATQDNLNADQVARLRVPRRTTAEQQRIGALRRAGVEDHARLLAATDRLARLIAERKRALITACVTGEFDVSAASDRAGDAPTHGRRENWEVER